MVLEGAFIPLVPAVPIAVVCFPEVLLAPSCSSNAVVIQRGSLRLL